MSLWLCPACKTLTGPEYGPCPKCGTLTEYATVMEPLEQHTTADPHGPYRTPSLSVYRRMTAQGANVLPPDFEREP